MLRDVGLAWQGAAESLWCDLLGLAALALAFFTVLLVGNLLTAV